MKKLLIVIALCFSLLLVGCGTSNTQGEKTPTKISKKSGSVSNDKTIKIGVITPLSGPADTYGSDMMHGYKSVIDEVNTAGGIEGKQITFVVEDGKCNGDDAGKAVKSLVDQGVVAILGGACSAETAGAGKIAFENQIPLISAISSSPEISDIQNFVYRYWNDADAGKTMTDYMNRKGAKSIGLVYEATDYAVAYADTIREGFKGLYAVEEKIVPEEESFSVIAKNIAEKLPEIDFLVFIPQSEANIVKFIDALVSEGVWDSVKGKILTTELVIGESTIEQYNESVNGLRGVIFPSLGSFGSDAQQKTSKLLGGYSIQTSDVHVLLAADSADLLVSAIKTVGTDRNAINEYIQGVNETNSRNAYIPNFYFNEKGDGQGIPFSLVEIKDGSIVTISE